MIKYIKMRYKSKDWDVHPDNVEVCERIGFKRIEPQPRQSRQKKVKD